MSTLDRMLSVLMAAREARNGSTLRLGSGEVTSTRGRRSNHRRKSATLATESLEHRQMLALTVYSENLAQYAGTNYTGSLNSWTTIVAESGDNVFLQQVATREATPFQQEALYIADNSSFQKRIMVGGPKVDWLDTSILAEQQLQNFNVATLDDILIASGTERRDADVKAAGYPMVAPFTTGFQLLPDQTGRIRTDGYSLEGSITIVQPDGSEAVWTFSNYLFTNGRGERVYDGLPTIRTGIGLTEPAASGQYYPTRIDKIDIQQLEIVWSDEQLPKVPTVTMTGYRGDNAQFFSMTDRLPSAKVALGKSDTIPAAVLSLSNSTGPGLGPIIPSTFSGTLEIDGQSYAVSIGAGDRTDNTLYFNGEEEVFWGEGERRMSGKLIDGALHLYTALKFVANGNEYWIPRGYPMELSKARYAVEAGGDPVTVTVWAGHDIRAAFNINLLSPGSTVYLDSPIVTRSGDIEIAATNLNINAKVTTPDHLLIHGAAATTTQNVTQATGVASVSEGKVIGLLVQDGGVGYDNAVPTVTIEAPRAIQATAELASLTEGKLSSIVVINGGSGYVEAPQVFVDAPPPGGRRATAVAFLTGDSVSAIQFTDPGTGYTTAPTVTLSSALGTGAIAQAQFVGGLGEFRVLNGGSGYTPLAKFPVVINSLGGTGATAFAYADAQGLIYAVAAVDRGTGYTVSGTKISLPEPDSTAAFRQATGSAIVDLGSSRVIGLKIIDAGSGYGRAPAVTISAPRPASDEMRPGATVQGGLVTGIKLLGGTGLEARVGGVTASGGITTATVAVGHAGTGYAVGDLLSIDSQAGGTGQAAQIRVLEVGAAGAVKRLGVVWDGSGYTTDEILVHDGIPAAGYGYQTPPRVWIDRPAAADGEQAQAVATLDSLGRISGFTMTNQGRGYSSAPAVQIESLLPLAQAETVNFNAAVGAGFYSIYLDDDRGTPAVDRSTLFVSKSASLASSLQAADGTALPAETVLVESHRGDVIVAGSINAVKQSYLLQSNPQDVMLFPYRFVARDPGDLPTDGGLTPVIRGGTVAITLANDLPTLANGGVAANDVDLVTQIVDIRIRTAWRSGADRTDPFPYNLQIEESDGLAIDAVAASGWPIIFSAVGNLETNAAIDTASDLVIRGVKSLTVTAPMKSGRNITLEAEQVAVRNSIEAREDLNISASNGNITMSGGTVTGRGAVRLNQKNTKVPKTIDYRSGSTATAIVKGKTVSVPIAVSGDFLATDVNVTLSITNPTLQYLEATLVSPSGARVPLFGQFALTGTNMKDAVFNDQSAKAIREGTAPYTTVATDLAGVTTERGFRTELQRLDNFNGYGVTGTWNLEVTVPTYGSDGTIDSVLLSLQNPAGGSSGSITSSSTIVADGLVIEAEGDVTARTDVNTVNAVTDGNLTLDDQGAMEVASARAGGAVWLTAAGVDPVSIDPITKSRTFGAALRATLVDVGSFFVSAPLGSVDVKVTAAKSITIAGNPNYTTDTTHGNAVAAGSVSIRSLGGSTGGDISVFDAPLAGGVDTMRQVKLATQSKLDAVYVAGTSGLYLSTLTAKQNGTLATALGGSMSLQKDDFILIKDGTLADGTKANGIYKVVDLGSATTPWKLARSIAVDTVQEFPAGSIVKAVSAAAADTFFRIDYQTTPDKPFGYADVDVQFLKVSANIGTDDPTDTVRFVVSNDSSLGHTDNNSPGSLGKMIDLAQQNDTSSSESNPVQTTEFLFSTNITSAIKLKQELPLIQQPLNIDGARRWNPFTNAAESGTAVAVDGTRIVTSRTGTAVTTQTVVNGFVFTASSGGTQFGSLANMIVGGFQGAAVKIDSAQNVVVDSNWIGGDKSGSRLGNRIGVMVTGSSDKSTEGVTISNNKIGGSGIAAVSLEGKAGGVSLFGNTIGFDGGDNVIGVDVTTTGNNSIGLQTKNRNVVGYNSTGIRLGVGSGDTTIENSEISYNVISGISIQGGKHQIGGPNTAAARNAVFANKGWGIRIDGKTGDSGTDLLTLANAQTIQNNLFISPAAAPGDISTRNLRGAIGIRNAPLTTVGDFSLKSDGRKYEVDPITGTDSQGNQYIPLADIVGPDLTVQAARSVSGPLPSTITSSGLTVKGSDATRVKAFVLRLADGGSGVDASTVVKEAFSLTLNGKPLTEGTDYTFSFPGGNASEVSFTCKTATGFFAQGRYVVTATGKSGTSSGSDSVTGGILTDAANNPLKGNQTGASLATVAKFTMLLSDVPGIVTGVTPSLGDASAPVSWTAPPSPAGAPITTYVVEYTAAGGPWQPFPHADSTATSLIVTGLTNGVPYTFRVAAVNEAGTGTFSAASSSVTPRTLASAPQNLQATAGNTSALLAWAAPLTDGGAAITDYDIQKSTDAGKTWSDVVDGVSTSRTATVSSLTNGTAYLFRVATVTTAGRGAWTAATAPVTPFGLPEIATNLLARATEGSAVLTWTAASSNGAAISDYLIQKSTDGGTNWIDVDDGVSSAATATVSGLNNGTAYVFRVAAKSVAGTGGWTAASAAVTPLSRATAPLSLQAVAGDGQAILSWVMPVFTSGAAITDYHIQKSVNGGTTWSDVADGVSNATTATITGLTNGTTYLFRVAAVTSVGDGAWSLVSAAVVPHGLVSVPQKIQGVGSDGQVTLTWDSPASTGGMPVIDYLVQSSSDGGANWATVTDAASATTGATVTGLDNGTSYLFRVAAVTDILTSDFSSATAAIVPLAAPGAATGLRSVPGTGQIVLVWQAPTKNGGRQVTDYDIEYKAVGSVSWVPYSHVPTAATTATIVGLAASNGYVFRVTPVTEFARGLSVETTEAVVLVPQPTRVGGRAAIGSVLLTWLPPKVNRSLRVIDYRIQYSTDGGATWTTASKAASTSTRATVRGLTSGTGYIFRVAAVTARGLGAYSVSSARVIPR